MRKIPLLFLIVALVSLWVDDIRADQFMGGFSYQYTTSAKTIPQGAWMLRSHSRATSISIGSSSITNVTLASSLNYGALKNLELELTSILYQDVNNPVGSIAGSSNKPDGGYFRWKYGNIPLFNLITFGILGSLRSSMGDYADVYLEPYYSEAYAAEIDYLFSYFHDKNYPDQALQIHYNLGYINYNDSEDIFSSTDAIKANLALSYPLPFRKVYFDFILESHGLFFRQYRDGYKSSYSIEDYAYLTSSLVWKITPSWRLMGGIDFLVYQGEEMTNPSSLPRAYRDTNYPSYRVSYKLSWLPFIKQRPKRRIRLVEEESVTVMEPMPGEKLGIGQQYDWKGFLQNEFDYVQENLRKIREERKKLEEQQKEEAKKKTG